MNKSRGTATESSVETTRDGVPIAGGTEPMAGAHAARPVGGVTGHSTKLRVWTKLVILVGAGFVVVRYLGSLHLIWLGMLGLWIVMRSISSLPRRRSLVGRGESL